MSTYDAANLSSKRNRSTSNTILCTTGTRIPAGRPWYYEVWLKDACMRTKSDSEPEIPAKDRERPQTRPQLLAPLATSPPQLGALWRSGKQNSNRKPTND